MANENQPTIRVLGFKTTYESLPKRGTDPLNDTTDDRGFLVNDKGRRIMEMQAEDWAIFAPVHSPINTRNVERVRHLMVDPQRMGNDQDGVKLAFTTARWSQIEPAYDAWKRGQDAPTNGTPLAAWPGVNADQVEVLRQFGMRSVEDVRDLAEGQIERVRLPGMRELRKQAGLFLDNMGAAEVARREAERDLEMEGMREQMAQMQELLRHQAPAAPEEPVDDEVAAIRAQLDSAGITYDRRWGAPKLRAMLPVAA